jgi:hypothetical protein
VNLPVQLVRVRCDQVTVLVVDEQVQVRVVVAVDDHLGHLTAEEGRRIADVAVRVHRFTGFTRSADMPGRTSGAASEAIRAAHRADATKCL